MNVDSQFPQPLPTVQAYSPPAKTPGQDSERPVDRPEATSAATDKPRDDRSVSASQQRAVSEKNEQTESREVRAENDEPAAPPAKPASESARVGELLDVIV